APCVLRKPRGVVNRMARQDRQRVNLQDGGAFLLVREDQSAVNDGGSNRSEAGDEGRGGKISERKGLRPSQGG
ncbi:MAG: hypothetical protein RL077_918, partial [Verrucomicrobiota bacterium]